MRTRREAASVAIADAGWGFRRVEGGEEMKAHWLKGGALARTICALLLIGCGECGGPGDNTGSNSSGSDMDAQDMDESRDEGTLPDPDMPADDEDMPADDADMSSDDTDMSMDEDMSSDMGEDMTTGDETPPVVTITSSMLAGVDGSYTLTGTLMDDVGVESATYVLGDGTEQALTFASGMFSVDLSLVDDPTTITVVAEDAAGNSGEASIEVDFEEPPPMVTASFTVSAMPQVNNAVVFDASASTGPDGEDLTYTWTFSDGVVRDGVKVGRIFHEPGSIQATLLVEADVLSDQVDQQVTISAPMPIGTAALAGVVVDRDRGALKDVEVLDPSGQVLAVTDRYGRFQVTIDRAVPVVLRYRREGWVDQVQRLVVPEDAATWNTQAQMIRHGETLFLEDAAAGGDVLTTRGVRVSFPPDAFVDDQGNAVDGDIAVRITPLDTSGDQLGAFPGGAFAMNPQGDVSFMATHGTMEVELRQDQREVFIAPGKMATVEIPIYTSIPANNQIDLWSLDEISGLWVSEGKGQVIQVGAGLSLRADVSHFSWWNADDFIPAHSAPIITQMDGMPFVLDQEMKLIGQTVAETGPRSVYDTDVPSPMAAPNFKIQMPVGQEMELQGVSADGHIHCSGTFPILGNEPGYPMDCIDTQDPAEPGHTALSYGDSITHTFTADGEEQLFTFDAQAGDFARVRIISNGGSNATAEVVSLSGWRVLTTSVAFNQTEALVYQVPDERTVTFAVRSGDSPGDIGIELEKVVDENIEQETQIDEIVDASQKRWTFWANAGQTIHVRFFGQVPFDSVKLFHEGQQIFATGERFGGLESMVYSIEKTGMYVLQQDISGALDPNDQYSFTVTDMPPPYYVATSGGRARFSNDLSAPGKVHRYVSPVSAHDSILARPVAMSGTPQPYLSERYLDIGGWTESRRSSEEGEGSISLEKLGPGVSGTKPYFHAVYHRDGNTGIYDVDLEKLPEVASVKVGDSSCAMSQTSYLVLAVSALNAGGSIELCDGTHETFDGIDIGDGAAVIGSDSSLVTLRGWASSPIIEDGVSHLEGVTVVLDGRDGVSIEYDRANPTPTVLRDVRVLGAANTSSNTALVVSAFGTISGPDNILIEDVEVVGPIRTGLTLDGLAESIVDGVVISNASHGAITLGGTDGVVLSNFNLSNVASGILASTGRVTDTTIDTGTIVLGATSTGGNYGIELLERANNNVAPGASVIRNVSITLAADGDTGISTTIGDAPSAVTIEGNLVDGGNHATRGVWVLPRPSSGSATLINNIIIEHDYRGVDVGSVDRLASLYLANNSFGNTSPDAQAYDLVYVASDSSTPTTSVEFYNNLFVGHGSALDTGLQLNRAFSYFADYNLFWNLAENYRVGSTVEPDALNDISGMDPEVNNALMEVNATSPAVDAGNPAEAPATDYDGDMRPLGNGVDIGAHEQ